ncbi:predicted protein [Aspergillus lentulus]|nr:predicted protein [Aspergillus lentulus]
MLRIGPVPGLADGYIPQAIIIGGGPAGLAAAIRLKAYNGIDTSVYELRPEPTTFGGAVNIPSNGLRLIDRLGLYEKLCSRGSYNREGWEAFGEREIEGFKENLLQVIRSASGSWADRLREIIRKTETIKFYPIYKMPTAATWATKRCLLMGDAAHAMQPHAGQGASMALEDVFLFSRLLEGTSRPLMELFQDYESIRRPRVEAIARLSSENGNLRKNASPLGFKAKEIALGVGFWLYKMAGLQKWGIGMQQKEFAYDIMDEPLPPRNIDN